MRSTSTIGADSPTISPDSSVVLKAGIMDHRSSILEAQRAVGQLLDRVVTA